MRAPIHSQKHFHQVTLSTATTLAESDSVFLSSVHVSDKNNPNEVEEGAIVKAVFLEMWVIGSSQDQFYTAIFHKMPAGVVQATFSEMTNLTEYDNKKNILFTSQGLASNDGVGNPIPIHRGWLKIPKGKQRMGLGDALVFQIASRGDATISFCGLGIYKEYT